MVKVSASLLSIRDKLKETTIEFNDLDIDYIHLDIMDNLFVPYNSFTNDEIKLITTLTNKPLDVHLMVKDIDKYIYDYVMLNTKYITIHYEALEDTSIIKKIKNFGIKCGISIKPNTNVEKIYDLLPLVDMVLIMSVEPGRGGQEFIPSALEKVKKLKDKIKNDNLDVIISIDGGINNIRAIECLNSGVDMLVIGSALVNSENKEELIKNIKKYENSPSL